MQSLRSKIFISLIRNRHLFKFKLKPEVVDESFSVEEFREGVDRASRRMKLSKDVSSKEFKINNIQAEWIIPDNAVENKVLLYIHGGGFISGSCLTHRMHVAKFAKGCQMKSLVFDYRLAPEHPFPAGLDDCVEVYQYLLDQGYKASDIVVGGESAGATLVLSLLLALRDREIDLPQAAFSISPVVDLSCSAESFKYNASKDIAPMNSWNIWTQMYVGETDIKNPLLSPLFGDYKNFPPIYICVGTHEIHLDDCINMAKVIERDGSPVILRKWENMVHAFPIMSPLFPEAKQAMSEICEFVRSEIMKK